MALANTYVDGDAMTTVHAAHHNAMASALNEMAGGSTGQIPYKTTGTDWDITWAAPPSGGGGSFVSSAKWGTD